MVLQGCPRAPGPPDAQRHDPREHRLLPRGERGRRDRGGQAGPRARRDPGDAHGYDTPLGSRGGALSGGQRQRVSIARALLRRPPVLVLDEPTSALDMRSESLVHTTFSELKGEVTIFVIAHRLSTLNTCDRIMVMQRGRLQAFGDREELERDNEFYRDAIRLSQIRN
ncbi:MAG: ATP-binding cassette domain-containing protein [Acidimicrobiales bacterium]